MSEEISAAEQPKVRDVPKNLRPYFLCLLLRGERWNETEGSESEDLLPKHLSFLRKQSEAGRYLLAGPVLDDADFVGLSVIQARSLAEAQSLAAEDPGVQARRLRVEVHPVLLPSLAQVQTLY